MEGETFIPKPLSFSEYSGTDLLDVIPKKVLEDPKKRKDVIRVLNQARENPSDDSPETVGKLKSLGIHRPPWITKEKWFGQGELTPLDKVICYMSAWGMKNSEISTCTGSSSQYVKETLLQDNAKIAVSEIQEKVWGRDPKKWIESILPEAINTALRIMNDETQKGSTRLQAAEGFIDRALGKAQQKIEVNDTSMRRIIEKLDHIESLKKKGLLDEEGFIEAEFSEAVEGTADNGSKPILDEDEVDSWIRKNYPV